MTMFSTECYVVITTVVVLVLVVEVLVLLLLLLLACSGAASSARIDCAILVNAGREDTGRGTLSAWVDDDDC